MIATCIAAIGLLQASEPPGSIRDFIRPNGPIVHRVAFDDHIAVYFGEAMDRKVDWMNEYIRDAWRYMKRTYGSFGGDGRIYVVAHKNTAFNYATINNRFDRGFGYRNVIDLGGSWDWHKPAQLNFEVITHELAHIVEGASKNTKESPAFEFWGDGPWPEIFIYDVYVKLGKREWAEDWFNRMLTSKNGHYGGPKSYFFFRDWFYPIYSKHGGVAVFDRYFSLLAKHFPKKDIEVEGGAKAKEYARRATFGEVLHFFSAAANADLREQYKKAFGWDDKIETEWQKAQQGFPDLKYQTTASSLD
jgi:hypothetical protein